MLGTASYVFSVDRGCAVRPVGKSCNLDRGGIFLQQLPRIKNHRNSSAAASFERTSFGIRGGKIILE